MGLDADFLSPASTAFLRYHFNGVYPEDDAVEVAVLHYQDFLGQVWHTTWNLDPGTGQPAKLRFPVVWNKQKWEEHSHLVRFCEYCGLQAQPG